MLQRLDDGSGFGRAGEGFDDGVTGAMRDVFEDGLLVGRPDDGAFSWRLLLLAFGLRLGWHDGLGCSRCPHRYSGQRFLFRCHDVSLSSFTSLVRISIRKRSPHTPHLA